MSYIWEKAEEITNEVSKRLGIPIDAIFSGYRGKSVVAARQEAMALCRKHGYSLPEIGRFFNRDHTTVLHAVRKMNHKALA